jgi:hypothetical protein
MPQELNTTRPEAKFFITPFAVEALYPRVTIVPTIRTFFSLKRLVVVDT